MTVNWLVLMVIVVGTNAAPSTPTIAPPAPSPRIPGLSTLRELVASVTSSLEGVEAAVTKYQQHFTSVCTKSRSAQVELIGQAFALIQDNLRSLSVELEVLGVHTASCNTSCAVGMFECADGAACVLGAWRCDGEDDCADGSDEWHCPSTLAPLTSSLPPSTLPVKVTCQQNEFACHSGSQCVRTGYQCDGDLDCEDGSDEDGCVYSTTTSRPDSCGEGEIACKSGAQCVRKLWLCDGERDCADGSDEEDCNESVSCEVDEFACKSGSQCVRAGWQCDGDRDCQDGSDEEDCDKANSTSTPPPTTPTSLSTNPTPIQIECGERWLPCRSGNKCVRMSWVCDGEPDCADNSDEEDCPPSTEECEDGTFKCRSGYTSCVYNSWVCDGDDDCSDGSDEDNCDVTTPAPLVTTPAVTCRDTEVPCDSLDECVLEWQVCDGRMHCSDGSDEQDCGHTTFTSTPLPTIPATDQTKVCRRHEFLCGDGVCVPVHWRCDKIPDCADGSDELDCQEGCPADHFECKGSRQCIPEGRVCDGVEDCVDSSDEDQCQDLVHRNDGCPECSHGCVALPSLSGPRKYMCTCPAPMFLQKDEVTCGTQGSPMDVLNKFPVKG